jgi:hypothetical protein
MTTRYINTSSAGGDGTTNAESGANAAYASWASFITNEYPVTATDAWNVYLDSGSTDAADTAQVTLSGFSGSATNRITFQPNTGNEHDGKYATGRYRSTYFLGINCSLSDSYTTILGLQFLNARTSTTAQKICISSTAAITESYVVGCILRLNVSTTDTLSYPLIFTNASMTKCGAINCLAYNWAVGGDSGGIHIRADSASPNQNFAYNCTSVDSNVGFSSAGGNSLWKNCLTFGCTTPFFNNAGADTTNSTNNAADVAASNIPGSNSVDLSSYAGTDIFLNYANDNFKLGSGNGRAAIDREGADLDSDTYYAVTLDAISVTRHATAPSIGFNEYPIELIIQNAAHSQASDNVVITQAHVLSMQNAQHSQQADNTILTQLHVLTTQNASHSQVAGSPILTQAHTIAVENTAHSQSADTPVLTQIHVLVVSNALHSQLADNINLTQAHLITVQDALHSQVVENVILDVSTTLQIQNATHAQASDNVVITQSHLLIVTLIMLKQPKI